MYFLMHGSKFFLLFYKVEYKLNFCLPEEPLLDWSLSDSLVGLFDTHRGLDEDEDDRDRDDDFSGEGAGEGEVEREIDLDIDRDRLRVTKMF